MTAKIVQFPSVSKGDTSASPTDGVCCVLGCTQTPNTTVSLVNIDAPTDAVIVKHFCSEHAQLCNERAPSENFPVETVPELSVPKPLGFDDIEAAFNMRDWLRSTLEQAGCEVTGAGMGFGQGDVDIKFQGCAYNVSIRPIKRDGN